LNTRLRTVFCMKKTMWDILSGKSITAGVESMTRTLIYKNPVWVRARASAVGPKESEGPLGDLFDIRHTEDLLGCESWELAESALIRECVQLCMEKGGVARGQLGAMLSGDLLNQLMASGFAARDLGEPFLGMYGACSTFLESTLAGAALVDGGYRENVIVSASSHFCTAERQFRYPLEMGTQRPPSGQWTCTAAGAMLLDSGKTPGKIRVECATLGRVVDYQVTDANHMGAAMAPAAFDTLQAHLQDMGREIMDYDAIVTGDLGWIGRELLMELCSRSGMKFDKERFIDCGNSVFYREQDPHAGGSGCGCVASVTCAWILSRVESGEWKRALVIGTGAMLSVASTQQKQSIPCIAYAASFEGV